MNGLYIITKSGETTFVFGYLSDTEVEEVNSIAKSFKGNSNEFVSNVNSILGTSLGCIQVREVFRIN